jgi:hypothetical protein
MHGMSYMIDLRPCRNAIFRHFFLHFNGPISEQKQSEDCAGMTAGGAQFDHRDSMRERVEIICKGEFENLVFGFSCLGAGAGIGGLTLRGK